MVYTIDCQNLTQIQSQQQSFLEEAEKEDMSKFLSTLMEELESQLDPGFFQDNNDVKKTKTTTNIATQK